MTRDRRPLKHALQAALVPINACREGRDPNRGAHYQAALHSLGFDSNIFQTYSICMKPEESSFACSISAMKCPGGVDRCFHAPIWMP